MQPEERTNGRVRRDDRYEPFLLRSAHRFFIASDNRFLPSAVRPRRLRFFGAGGLATAFCFVAGAGASVPSSAAMARLSRSLSLFKSATIRSRSKFRSYGALILCRPRFFLHRCPAALQALDSGWSRIGKCDPTGQRIFANRVSRGRGVAQPFSRGLRKKACRCRLIVVRPHPLVLISAPIAISALPMRSHKCLA